MGRVMFPSHLMTLLRMRTLRTREPGSTDLLVADLVIVKFETKLTSYRYIGVIEKVECDKFLI